ncbi:hypothetical protein ACEUZ9_004653 [Paracoccus litorisediminis]|uniref:hypothetical protein n=1 Tax=Paracoccus litorisediminis TaxID=2006130 RepID=UPI003734B3D9
MDVGSSGAAGPERPALSRTRMIVEGAVVAALIFLGIALILYLDHLRDREVPNRLIKGWLD